MTVDHRVLLTAVVSLVWGGPKAWSLLAAKLANVPGVSAEESRTDPDPPGKILADFFPAFEDSLGFHGADAKSKFGAATADKMDEMLQTYREAAAAFKRAVDPSGADK